MVLESGPATKDRNYRLLVFLLFAGFSLYFFYDWKIGYPEANRVEAREHFNKLGLTLDPTTLGETPSKEQFEQMASQQPTSPAQVREMLGIEPTFTRSDGGAIVEFYPTLYGFGTVHVRDGVVMANPTWQSWPKGKDKIQGQLYFGIITALVSLYLGYRVYQAATLTATIDDSGMTYGGKRIPFESMRSLRDYSPKGWVDLYYDDGGNERKLRIDDQKIRKFNEIIDHLVQVKGFAHPIKAYQQAKAAEETEPA